MRLTKVQKKKAIEDELDTMEQIIANHMSTIIRLLYQRINVPEIYVPDPININPNLIANVERVLLHIETIRMELQNS